MVPESMDRRSLLFFPALAAAATAVSSSAAAAQQQQPPAGPPPNILLIIADDLAAWMLGCYGNQEIKTPNIDNLARRGVRFQHGFVCTPICSPSRATLFTGRTPMQHGIHDFLTDNPIADPPQGQKEVPASMANEVMLTDVAASKGYDCGYVGKWHINHDNQKPGHGIRWWYTMTGGSMPYNDPKMSLNGQLVEEKGYAPELMTRRATEFLDQQKPDKPFFLTVSYPNPHTPYDGHPQKYYDMYAKTSFDTIGWEPPAANALREKDLLKDTVGNIRRCAAATTALDDQLPPLLDKLKQKGLYDNTVILFGGDNGFLLGRHGLWSKGLASNPPNMYEEVVNVPMIMTWPGRIPVESARPELVSFYDVMPTICELTGASVPSRNLCGRSLVPLVVRNPRVKPPAWRGTVFAHLRNADMARDNRFKLVVRNDGKGPNELFDLRADPREKVNQYSNPQFLTARDRLAKELSEWKSRYSS
jgi:choline-sulfatase